jgi:glycosyltransferase involved in cell wall biosynthesis
MISVCLATYNGAKYIREQLDSIIYQLDKNDEIIISDDGSSDETLTIIESYNDSRIILYKNSFKNVVLNFEFVIGKSKGDYIFLADQDDIWHKDKVKCYMDCFLKKPNISLLFSDIQIIDKYGIHLDRLFYKNKFSDNLFKNLFKNNFIGCTMAFTKASKNIILPFPTVIAMHDWWIGGCCKIHGRIFFIDKKLHFYRRHETNATKEKGESFSVRLKWRVNLIKCLFLRYIKIRRTFNKSIN